LATLEAQPSARRTGTLTLRQSKKADA